MFAGLALSTLLQPGLAGAQARAYRGPHPIDLDGHWHLEDAVHVHDELPVGLEPFGDVDGVLVFLADPLAWGYAGEVWTFRGAHPMPGGMAAYCGLPGEHRHPFAPEGSYRRESSGAYLFTGAMRGGRRMVRPGRVAPRHPVVTRPAIAPTAPLVTSAPFFQLGCLHTWVRGHDGRPVAIPMGDCVPRVHETPPAVRPSAPAPSPVERPYTSTFSGPGLQGRRLDTAGQGGSRGRGSSERTRPSSGGRLDR